MPVFPWELDGGMRGDANGARDLFAPVKVGKEVLAESLASHGWNSVAGGRKARPDRVGIFAPQVLRSFNRNVAGIRTTQRRKEAQRSEPKWEECPIPPGIFVRVANKGFAGYGTWKC